jgi:hypothetical protein
MPRAIGSWSARSASVTATSMPTGSAPTAARSEKLAIAATHPAVSKSG